MAPRTGRRRRGVRWLPILLFAGYAIYYYVSNRQTVALTGRTQVVELSTAQETALGLSSYQRILSGEKVIQQGPAVDAVRGIGRRLAKVAEDPGFEWVFNVIESPQANAFALPGGKVAVYTGILPITKTVDGLAVVMGHEIAHAIARHGAERMAHQKLVDMGKLSVGTAVGEMDVGTQKAVLAALGVGSKYGMLLPFSRNHESEADYMGLIYVARACFDPREAPNVWRRMGELSKGGGKSEFTSTHPSHDTRISQFQEWMPEALEIRKKHCKTALAD